MSTELEVIYDDYADVKPDGSPKRKRDSLANLLERARTGSVEAAQTVIKHVDICSFALDSIRATDTVLDKIAKVEGLYKQTFEPPEKMTDIELAREIYRRLIELDEMHSGRSRRCRCL